MVSKPPPPHQTESRDGSERGRMLLLQYVSRRADKKETGIRSRGVAAASRTFHLPFTNRHTISQQVSPRRPQDSPPLRGEISAADRIKLESVDHSFSLRCQTFVLLEGTVCWGGGGGASCPPPGNKMQNLPQFILHFALGGQISQKK